jgi:DNA-binding NarL/FixJ family response regulator
MTDGPIRVLLVDDHALVSEALGERLNAEPDLEVVGTAANAHEALAIASAQPVDLVLMDVDMPGMSCFDAASRLNDLSPGVRLVFLSAHWQDHYIQQALRVKAAGYLTKAESPRQVIQAVRRIARGEMIFSPEVRSRIIIGPDGPDVPDDRRTRLSTLSPRELEVLGYIAQGMSKRRIAGTMFVSVKTVASHTSNIMSKLEIHDRVELARFAIREGLSEP